MVGIDVVAFCCCSLLRCAIGLCFRLILLVLVFCFWCFTIVYLVCVFVDLV